MEQTAIFSATSNVGKFVISDPCYVLPDDVYYDVWEKLYDFKIGTVKVDEASFAVVNVPEFDATGIKGTNYMVDSGTFGVIAYELCDPEKVSENSDIVRIVPGHLATIVHNSTDETIEVFVDSNPRSVEFFYYGYEDEYEDNYEEQERDDEDNY